MNEEPPNHQTGGISLEVRNLGKSFGPQQVLKGISFRVEPGEIFVIMGLSGSGKSTATPVDRLHLSARRRDGQIDLSRDEPRRYGETYAFRWRRSRECRIY